MTRPIPDRAPVKPHPLTHNPHEGDLAVVVSFRIKPLPGRTKDWYRETLEHALRVRWAPYRTADDQVHGLSVGVRVIGQAGEASRDEGKVG